MIKLIAAGTVEDLQEIINNFQTRYADIISDMDAGTPQLNKGEMQEEGYSFPHYVCALKVIYMPDASPEAIRKAQEDNQLFSRGIESLMVDQGRNDDTKL